ncbi:MAG: hypothetical protein GX938_10740 [Spirochaetales bacterium]|nr:hypothetical protein [Spirochaetales bacterium]
MLLKNLTDEELIEKAKEGRREYMRKYRQRPGYKERNADYQRNYWARKALEAEAAANDK